MAEKTQALRAVRSIKSLDMLQSDVMDKIGRSTVRTKDVSEIERHVDEVVDANMQQLGRGRGTNTSAFLYKSFNSDQKNTEKVDESLVSQVFDDQAEGLYGLFQNKHESLNAKYDDLESITKRMTDLEEAVYTTRDSILTSDNLTASISRTISFGNSETDEAKDDEKSYTSIIEDMEERFKLTKKIRDHIVPKTLMYGTYYAYTVPYTQIFKQHEYLKNKKMGGGRKGAAVFESAYDPDFIDTKDVETILENAVGEYEERHVKAAKEGMTSILNSMQIVDDEASVILEYSDMNSISALMDFRKMKKQKMEKPDTKQTTDGVNEFDGGDEINDCYMRLIDPRKIIPIKIMEETIGYYYLHQNVSSNNQINMTFSQRMSLDLTKSTKQESMGIEDSFITRIVDQVVKKFNRPYLEENVEFKRLIVDALMYNDTYRHQVQFQFIPVDYITEFKVNEDENGDGVSMLEPALFYAKLYMSLLMFNTITYIAKSGDQRIFYVKKSTADTNITNQVQRIARSLKQGSLNFNDLMSYSSMLAKVGKNRELFIPVGESGERPIEFDTMAGQQVDMDNPLMDDLKRSAINSTGVPSVLSNYVNEADYAKTLVMANAKYLARTVMHQQDFNESITELYRKLFRFTTDTDESVVNRLRYKLALPATLNTMNYSDLINNADQLVAFFVKVLTGEQASQEEIDNLTKDKFYKEVVMEQFKMFNWDRLREQYENSQLEATREMEKKKEQSDQGSYDQ